MDRAEDDRSYRIKRASERVARVEGALQGIFSAGRDITPEARVKYVLSAVGVLGRDIDQVRDLAEKILLRHREEAHRELARLIAPQSS